MIREDRFVQSHRPYAVNLNSLRTDEHGQSRLDAIWFRRRNGRTAACIGQLWDFQRPRPADAQQFLDQHDDGRYGGDCRSRWDGHQFWSADQNPDVQAADLALLKPILDAYPAIPAGHSGWWRF